MDSITRNKMVFLEQKEKVISTLLKVIDPDDLEQRYGGNNSEPTQYWPPKILERYTLSKRKNIFNDVKENVGEYDQQYCNILENMSLID